LYKIITTKNCPKCHMAKLVLEKYNLKYMEIEAYSEQGRNICSKLNIMSAGTVLDNNDNIIDIKEITNA
jgi:glutaredoxin